MGKPPYVTRYALRPSKGVGHTERTSNWTGDSRFRQGNSSRLDRLKADPNQRNFQFPTSSSHTDCVLSSGVWIRKLGRCETVRQEQKSRYRPNIKCICCASVELGVDVATHDGDLSQKRVNAGRTPPGCHPHHVGCQGSTPPQRKKRLFGEEKAFCPLQISDRLSHDRHTDSYGSTEATRRG
uniref:Uncharacterized protein n=1 Tax=Branchiostoma floridae TaxID=7739 RepID=C3ZNT8_BRAFL|eukprot:XP_002589809.1 hypothetical protein BRAFLDRAFT_90497 [Branchiostoma floridae]